MSNIPIGYPDSRYPKAKLEAFPAELLERILLNLNERDAATCRRISRTFRDVVRGSLRLQYRLECFLARVVDNPSRKDVGLQERLEKVKGWRDAFRTHRWTGKTQVTVTHPLDGYDEEDYFLGATSGVFARAFGPAYILQACRCVTVIQQSSHYKGRPEKKWVIQDPGFLPRDFAYDAYQKILVLAEKIDELNYRVHLMAPSGGPHPLVAIPTLPISVPEGEVNLEMDSKCHVLLHSELLLISVVREDEFGDVEIWLYNWQTGMLLLNVRGFENALAEPRGVAFLDSRHILLSLYDPFSYDGLISTAGIAVLDIYPANPLQQFINDAAQSAKIFLSLPEPMEEVQYNSVFAFGQPPPSSECATSSLEIFSHGQDASLVGITFEVAAVGQVPIISRTFTILVNREFIQFLLAAPPTQTDPGLLTIPWEDWAPHARMLLREPIDDPQLKSPPLLASRCFTLPDHTCNDLDIIDFDFVPKKNHRMYPDAFTQPATTVEPMIWANPLRTGSELSFRRSMIKSIPSLEFPDDNFVVGEDFIVVLRPRGEEETIVETYWI